MGTETFCSSSVSALILEMDLFEETHSFCLWCFEFLSFLFWALAQKLFVSILVSYNLWCCRYLRNKSSRSLQLSPQSRLTESISNPENPLRSHPEFPTLARRSPAKSRPPGRNLTSPPPTDPSECLTAVNSFASWFFNLSIKLFAFLLSLLAASAIIKRAGKDVGGEVSREWGKFFLPVRNQLITFPQIAFSEMGRKRPEGPSARKTKGEEKSFWKQQEFFLLRISSRAKAINYRTTSRIEQDTHTGQKKGRARRRKCSFDL